MEKAIGIQIKPVGNVCNIACKYCYARPFIKNYQLMSMETIETLVRKMCSYQKNLLFTWHGGEPLLPGLDFYKKVMDIIEKYSDGHEIKHVVQTNGTLIDKDFACFLVKNKFEIGISLDGTKRTHDLNRILPTGYGTFDKVMRGVNFLREFGYNPSTISTVTKETLPYAVETFDFLTKNGFKKLKFSPVYDSATDSFSISNDEWFEYIKQVFYRWLELDDDTISVREIDEVISWFGDEPFDLCSTKNICLSWASIDPDGELYPCEYLRSEMSYGNIKDISIEEMFKGIAFNKFKQKFLHTPEKCKQCEFYKFCGNGCPAIRVDEMGNLKHDGVYVYCKERRRLYEEIKKHF